MNEEKQLAQNENKTNILETKLKLEDNINSNEDILSSNHLYSLKTNLIPKLVDNIPISGIDN